jgi:hypothetical protein
MSDVLVTGEVSNSKLAAVFASRAAAAEAVDALVAGTDVEATQVKLIAPGERDIGIKLEPEGRNIWRTIVVSHARLGVLGAFAGLVLFAVLTWIGVAFVVNSPWAAAGVCLFFGAIAGLMLGGLVSLRPDHTPYIAAARAARDHGQTTVLVHALSAEQRSRAAEFLAGRGGEVTQTL